MPWIALPQPVAELAKNLPPGAVQLVMVEGRRLCLAHTRGGFRLSAASCPHLGESLAQGHLSPEQELVCPLHHYRFELLTGQESQQRCAPLRIYPSKEEEGRLLVFLR